MGLSHLDADALAKWIGESLETQGLELAVTDPLVLRKVSTLLNGRAV
jgi:hypothetical protein